MVDILVTTIDNVINTSMVMLLPSSVSMYALVLAHLSMLQPSLSGIRMMSMTSPSKLVAFNESPRWMVMSYLSTFVQGLPQMIIHPFSDQEWENQPHVILKSEHDWNSGQLDIALEDDD